MKSYILENISSCAKAGIELRRLLPGQENPWLLKAPDGDPVAYFKIEEELDGEPNCCVIADISGRHYSEDEKVVSVLQQLQTVFGGVIEYSP